MIARLAFPDDEHPPACASKLSNAASISNPGLLPLCSPELRICPWRAPPTFAAVHVPEAPMHKDDALVARKDEIGCSGKLTAVQPVSIAQ